MLRAIHIYIEHECVVVNELFWVNSMSAAFIQYLGVCIEHAIISMLSRIIYTK